MCYLPVNDKLIRHALGYDLKIHTYAQLCTSKDFLRLIILVIVIGGNLLNFKQTLNLNLTLKAEVK